MRDVETAFYLRMQVEDRTGVLADITQIFSQHKISIEAVVQKDSKDQKGNVPLIILSHRVLEANMLAALENIEKLTSVSEKIVSIRLETLD